MFRIKGKFICFIGIDGSGKTTLAKRLVEFAEQRGEPYSYMWLNARSFLITPFRKIALRLFLKRTDLHRDYSEYMSLKNKKIKEFHPLTKCYYFVLLVDYWLWIMYNLGFAIIRKRNIVCDRYVYDVVVSLGDTSENSLGQKVKMLDQMLRFLPQPDFLFILDVPEDVAFSRRDDISDIHYVSERRRHYLQLGKALDATILDGTKPLVDLVHEVFEIVNA